tara:strand:- start:1561 stop:3525 length:1965 start_codon:yes stop_codon:yes gene_type:complete
MSKTTILELRQLESQEDTPILVDGTQQNGIWTNTLDVPVMIENGDQINVKSVYCDTSSSASGYIEITKDIEISMTCALYLNNYNKDQQYTFAQTFEGKTGLQPLRNYYETIPSRTPGELGDNNKWFLSEVSPSQGYVWNCPEIQLNPLDKKENSNRYGGVLQLLYTGTYPGAKPYGEPFQLTIPPTKDKEAAKLNPYTLNIRCGGTIDTPAIILNPQCRLPDLGLASYELLKTTSSAAGVSMVTPQLFTHTFTLKGGEGVVYSPLEMSQLITDEINNAQSTGQAGINYIDCGPVNNTMKNYPVMSPFLTTIQKNERDIKLRQTATGIDIDQIFVNATGYNVPDDVQNGALYFTYDIDRMLNERVVTGAPGSEVLTTPALDAWVGANEIAMVYDEVENKLKWDIQHFPIYTGDTTAAGINAGDGKPTAAYNEAKSDGDFTVTSGTALQYSGIVWTDLSPASFWSDTLGFADAVSVPEYNKRMDYAGTAPPAGVNNSYQLITEDGINSTGAFPGLDLGVVHAKANYSRPIWGDAATGGGVDRQTDDVSSIFSTRTWNTSIADEGYFILDIGTNFTQNLVASNLTSHNTQSIVNRYYTANSFTSDQGAGSIMYQHSGEPIMLSDFNIAIRNPDRSLISSHILQPKNSVFVEIIKAGN